MLHYTAIFDAYGFGFEYTPADFVLQRNNLRTYQSHPKWKTKPGVYSDDTQMQMALAELMLRKPKPQEWSFGDLAKAFLSTFKRDPRKGYAGHFYDFLVSTPTPEKFLMRIRPHSDKSGGAMRAPVLGLLPDPQAVIDAALFQASITHATQDGVNAAIAAALFTHYFYHRLGPKADAWEWVGDQVPGPWRELWRDPIGSPGWQHVLAASTAIRKESTAQGVLKHIVGLTGDVDTAAAIAAPMAYYSTEIENDLPESLYQGLENGSYGLDYLTKLGRDLEHAFPPDYPDSGEDLIGELFG